MALNAGGTVSTHRTNRGDWDTMVTELYNSVIAGTGFGIGIASKEKGLLGSSLKMRLNQRFPNPAVVQFIKGNFKVKSLDRIFESEQGMEAEERSNLFKVKAGDMGLPKNCLIYRIENPSDKNMRAILIFGGEFLAPQLNARLQILSDILEGRTAAGKVDQALESPEDLMEALGKINVKRLFDYDMDRLSKIINGLEHTKNSLPKNLKPIFKSTSDYIIRKRVRS